MAPTKRTSWTWKENVAILDKLELLKHSTSQRSAAEQLNTIGFVFFSRYSWFLEGGLGPTGFYHPAAYIGHFGPVRRWMI